MSRPPRCSPPVRRLPLPFSVGDEIAEGVVFMSAGRWVVHASDELTGALYQEMRTMKQGADPVATTIGPALRSVAQADRGGTCIHPGQILAIRDHGRVRT